MINKLTLKNFTVFEDFEIDFSPKINVIVGENGTGKTHLLKAAYALCAGNNKYVDKGRVVSEDEMGKDLAEKLVRVFMPLDENLWNLRRTSADSEAEITAELFGGKSLGGTFNTNSKTVSIQDNRDYEQYSWKPTYIPTKEVLSFMKGFNSLYEKYEVSFDETYQDIILALDLPPLRADRLQPKAKWAIEQIENICGGQFIFHGSGKVTFKTKDNEYSANAMAEGFRKAGLLSRLLETGSIEPGVSGPLFWDEPESNMNPKLMRLLVQILLELSRNGQQIIIATHNYVFLKWFDSLKDKGREDQVRYHALYQPEPTAGVKIASTEEYSEITPNAIDDAYGDLTDEEISQSMGGLGK